MQAPAVCKVASMCSNYRPVTLQDRLLAHFGVVRPDEEEPPEFTAPGYQAPFIVRASHRDTLAKRCLIGLFGLLPEWAENLAFGRKTYNCRSETKTSKPAFREAWQSEHRCVIPAEVLYEPCYESGDPARWAIQRADGGPLGVAGLWGLWHDPAGREVLSFTMLTVNADGHPIYLRMHAPTDEKRMPVILREQDYDDWLHCSNEEAAKYIAQYPAELLLAYPDPVPWKVLPDPKHWTSSPDMFADEWRQASVDAKARALKARRSRPKPKHEGPAEEGPATGDLF